MNNSYIASENLGEEVVIDTTILLRQKQQETIKIVEAISKIATTKEWKELQELIFDKQVERLEKELQHESKANELLPAKIYRLQGKIELAKRYSDFYKLAETYKTELNNINLKLQKEATKEINENVTI